jgi:hypothetical protein
VIHLREPADVVLLADPAGSFELRGRGERPPGDQCEQVRAASWGLAKAGARSRVHQLPLRVGELVGQPSDAGMLTTAKVGRPATTFRPSEIVFTSGDGTLVRFGVLAGRSKRNGAPQNTETRDELMKLVNERQPEHLDQRPQSRK